MWAISLESLIATGSDFPSHSKCSRPSTSSYYRLNRHLHLHLGAHPPRDRYLFHVHLSSNGAYRCRWRWRWLWLCLQSKRPDKTTTVAPHCNVHSTKWECLVPPECRCLLRSCSWWLRSALVCSLLTASYANRSYWYPGWVCLNWLDWCVCFERCCSLLLLPTRCHPNGALHGNSPSIATAFWSHGADGSVDHCMMHTIYSHDRH